MIRILPFAVLLLFVAWMLAWAQPDAEGCAAVGRRMDSIRIAEESAIIVWDPVKKIEHFIRRAAFDTKSADFGFLVPTPTQPILAEVADSVFRMLDVWILPKIVERYDFHFEPISMICCFGLAGSRSAKSGIPESSVRILAEQKVGGFNATILEADDPESLSKWITDHGYSSDPELQSWLAPYVAAKWKITAFKIIQDPKTGQLATTRPVRMSFATDKPFFPYREPMVKDENQKHGPRLLRVFFISDTRMEGKLGNDAKWHAKVPWSDQLTDEDRTAIAAETRIGKDDLPTQTWLTTFEDSSSPRPGKDEIYFEPSQDRSPIRPVQIHYNKTWIPSDVFFVFVVFVGLIIIIVRRAARKNRTHDRIEPQMNTDEHG